MNEGLIEHGNHIIMALYSSDIKEPAYERNYTS